MMSFVIAYHYSKSLFRVQLVLVLLIVQATLIPLTFTYNVNIIVCSFICIGKYSFPILGAFIVR